MVVAVILTFVAVVTLAIVIGVATGAGARRKAAALTFVGQRLGHAYVGDANFVEGTEAGLPVRFMLTTRGAGRSAESWTELECKLPATTAQLVQLCLWPSGRELAQQVEQGRMIDIVVGDAPFDAAFVIEGAPTEIVRTALDGPTREVLQALRHCEIQFPRPPRGEPAAAEAPASFAVLQLAMRGWLEDEAAIIGALDALTRLAQRLRAAPVEVIEAIPLEGQGSPYRPALGDAARSQARERQSHEVRALQALRKRRADEGRIHPGVVLAYVVLVAIGLMAALGHIIR